jgi:mannosyl-3-phosphoglycerate phosphatase
MTSKLPLLVFTDLDGTLLDHNTYDWTPALSALAAVKQIGGGVILASSKTAAEMVGLRREMGLNDWPAIVENGAGMLVTEDAPETDYARIRACLDSLPTDLRSQFTGFGDLSETELVTSTGLTRQTAGWAKERRYSEPGLWRGSDAGRAEFERALLQYGITARAGGRFLTLSFGHLKSDRMIAIKDQYQPAVTIALGDAPNDIEMLEVADFGVIIANPDHTPLPPLQGEAEGRITRTKEPGPTGWNTAVHALLTQLELNKD